jgi:hypothetical protein
MRKQKPSGAFVLRDRQRLSGGSYQSIQLIVWKNLYLNPAARQALYFDTPNTEVCK